MDDKNVSKSMAKVTVRETHLCIEQPEVSETTDPHNTNIFAWTSTILLQWRVHCDTSTKHWRGLLGRNLIWDLENEVGGHPAVIRIPTIRLAAIRVLAVIRVRGIGAVVLDTA